MSVDLIEDIKADHAKTLSLFDEYYKLTDADKKQKIAYEIIRELSIHASTEEVVLYPWVKDHYGKELADRYIKEHLDIEQPLYDLDQMSLSDSGYEAKMDLIVRNTRAHIKEEESTLLPKLSRDLKAEELKELGQSWVRNKSRAPTRPHPSAPKQGIAAAAAALASKPLDAAKDAVRFAGQKSEQQLQQQQQRRLARRGDLGWGVGLFGRPLFGFGDVFSDTVENDKELSFIAELPKGFTKDDLKIQVEDGTLTVSGEKDVVEEQKDDDGDVISFHKSHSHFSRSVLLPDTLDQRSLQSSVEGKRLVVKFAKSGQQALKA